MLSHAALQQPGIAVDLLRRSMQWARQGAVFGFAKITQPIDFKSHSTASSAIAYKPYTKG